MPEISQEEYDKLKGYETKVTELNAEAARHRRDKNELQTQLNEATAQIRSLQAAIEKPNADFKEKEIELIEAARKAKEYGDSMRAQFQGKLIDEAISSAAIKGRAIDPQVVSKLLRENIGIDDAGAIFVKSGNGVAIDDSGQRIPVEKFVAGYLEKNPFLIAASGAQGTGSQGGRGDGATGAKEIKRSEFDKLNPMEKAAKMKAGLTVADD